MTQLIIYHKNCQDGIFSAYQFWLRNPNAYFIDLDYYFINNHTSKEILEYILTNNNLPIDDISYLKDIELYIADFSLPYNVIKDFSAIFKSILILDHHKTSFEDFKSNGTVEIIQNNWKKINLFPNCTFIYSDKESGTKLTYKYLNNVINDNKIPKYIKLVSDRDMWEFNFKETNLFYYGIEFVKPKSFNELDIYINERCHDLLKYGKYVETNLNNYIKSLTGSQLIYINCVDTSTNKNTRGGLINAELRHASELGNYIVTHKELEHNLDFCIIFIIKRNIVSCSIRSRKEFDCSLIAKKYNGGGHKNSAGFNLKFDELVEILTTKTLTI